MYMVLGSPSAASFGDAVRESDTGPARSLPLTGHTRHCQHFTGTTGSSPLHGNTEKATPKHRQERPPIGGHTAGG